MTEIVNLVWRDETADEVDAVAEIAIRTFEGGNEGRDGGGADSEQGTTGESAEDFIW